MKRNPYMEKCLKNITPEAKAEIDFSVKVSKRILDIMEERGLTQRDLAGLLGKSETEISRWLCGFHNFTLRTICKIETKLGVKIIEVSEKPVQKLRYIPIIIEKYVTYMEKDVTAYKSNYQTQLPSINIGDC